MKAMILAAGRGERMRPLTDTTPKPLLRVGGQTLIERQVIALVAGGFGDLVINHAWLGEQIEAHLGDGRRYGARICYSREQSALETLGGIVQALPLLGDAPFALVSADIYTEFDYGSLAPVVTALANHGVRSGPETPIAHLVLTDNPPFHPQGDMALIDGCIRLEGAKLNYGNIGVFHPRMFAGLQTGMKLKLFPWVYQFLDRPGISGEHFRGEWHNIGTPLQLEELDRTVRSALA